MLSQSGSLWNSIFQIAYHKPGSHHGEGWHTRDQSWQLSRKGESQKCHSLSFFVIFLLRIRSCPWSLARAGWPAEPAAAPAASRWTPPGSPRLITGEGQFNTRLDRYGDIRGSLFLPSFIIVIELEQLPNVTAVKCWFVAPVSHYQMVQMCTAGVFCCNVNILLLGASVSQEREKQKCWNIFIIQ